MYILNQVVFNDNLLSKLRITDIVIHALDDDTKQAVNAASFQKYLHSLFDDADFMRQLNYYSMLKTHIETSSEYFGQDYVSAPDYQYNPNYEAKVAIIEKKLAKFIGSIIKSIQEGVES